MTPPKTYNNGRQDAWIEAIRENCRQNVGTIMHRLDQHSAILRTVSAKVNHIYGGAVILGAVAGLIGSVVVQVVVGILLRRGSP